MRKSPSRRPEGAALFVFGFALTALVVLEKSNSVKWKPIGNWLFHYRAEVLLSTAGASCIAVGAFYLVRRTPTLLQRRTVRPIRWWVIAAAVASVAGATWISVSWLVETTTSNSAPTANSPSTRLDAIKTGLTVGAGVGAIIALSLNARRQWLTERAQEHTEEDATERRVTELYTKAAEQLGADKDPVVRLASLYSLERLAQDNPIHRQTIVNIMCAYLRMPFTPPPELPQKLSSSVSIRRKSKRITVRNDQQAAALLTKRQELQVRLTAQRILSKHLKPELGRFGRATSETFWADIDLDLTAAVLVDFTLGDCTVRNAGFSNAHFIGYTDFSDFEVTETAQFNDAKFEDFATFFRSTFNGGSHFFYSSFKDYVTFEYATFNDEVDFEDSKFDGYCSLSNSTFNSEVLFRDASFGRVTTIARATFNGRANFESCEFNGTVDFEYSQFKDLSSFEGVSFNGATRFLRTKFESATRFVNVKCGALMLFNETEFLTTPRFDNIHFFKEVQFDQAVFKREAWFKSAVFQGDSCSFYLTRFKGDARFDSSTFTCPADFDHAKFRSGARFNDAKFADNFSFDSAFFETLARFDGAIARVDVATSPWPGNWTTGEGVPRPTPLEGEWRALVRAHWVSRNDA
ncbi:pentapeptide repeat-containing protein [Amycolatopsis japonica]|uniref:pentapeptide repeat-containing protein n=1 Tax=Amycolatopsis japonica TaxID=208439 RepID=UPI00366DD4D4